MKYYKLSQYNGNMSNIITIPNISEDELGVSQITTKQIDNPKDKEFLNFYENPHPIVSQKLKSALEMYVPAAMEVPMPLTNPSLKLVIMYWFLNLDYAENQGIVSSAKISNTKSDANEASKISIKIDGIGERKIFKTKIGIKDHIIADLDVVEIILRNSIVDIQFTEIAIA